MTKMQFILALHAKLSDLPQDEVEERLNFYTEMIEDRMEEGLSEEEAVAAVGSVDEIAAQITADIDVDAPEMVKMETHRRLKTGEVVLIVLGFPVWFSLLLAGVAVLVSLIVVLWSLIVSLWAVFASLVACGLALVTGGIVLAALGNGLSGIAVMGAGLICAGLAIFLQFGCKAATKGSCFLTKMAVICWFRRKEAGK